MWASYSISPVRIVLIFVFLVGCLARTHYELLNVRQDASLDDIKKAFRRKAKELHPDKPGGNVDEFEELQNAYDVLRDSNSRQVYDDELRGGRRQPEMDGMWVNEYFIMNGRRYVRRVYRQFYRPQSQNTTVYSVDMETIQLILLGTLVLLLVVFNGNAPENNRNDDPTVWSLDDLEQWLRNDADEEDEDKEFRDRGLKRCVVVVLGAMQEEGGGQQVMKAIRENRDKTTKEWRTVGPVVLRVENSQAEAPQNYPKSQKFCATILRSNSKTIHLRQVQNPADIADKLTILFAASVLRSSRSASVKIGTLWIHPGFRGRDDQGSDIHASLDRLISGDLPKIEI